MDNLSGKLLPLDWVGKVKVSLSSAALRGSKVGCRAALGRRRGTGVDRRRHARRAAPSGGSMRPACAPMRAPANGPVQARSTDKDKWLVLLDTTGG